jgi:hypothetical protein
LRIVVLSVAGCAYVDGVAGRDETAKGLALPWTAAVMLVALVVFVSVLGALTIDDACHNTPPPVAVPEPGTDRAAYCDGVQALPAWLALVAGPALLASLALVALRRHPWWAVSAALAIVVLVVANASLAHSLEFAYTI